MSEIILKSLQGNPMLLDGGAMFGNAPRAMWSQWMAPDTNNRVRISSNCLLVKTPKTRILFETGTGAYLPPALKKRYGVMEESHVLLDSLAEEGLSHRDISHVILSHLHFDHSGGLLSAHEPGRGSRLLFPQARFITGKANFERCLSPHMRDRASFIPGLGELLEQSGRLDLVEGGDRLEINGVRIDFYESFGHTPGMITSFIRCSKISVVFAGDIAPGRHWVSLPITMGYDRFPEQLVDEKQEVLSQAQEEDAWIFYPHDHECVASKLARDEGRNRFVPVGAIPELLL